MVNPPDGGKYSHFINTNLPADPEEWLKDAAEISGSWWPDWHHWVGTLAKERVPARMPGDGKLKAIEDAPGSHVNVRLS